MARHRTSKTRVNTPHVPAIRVLQRRKQQVDAGDERRHDA